MSLLIPSIPPGRKPASTLQPTFFTSSLFVDPLRRDIASLLQAFLERCSLALRTQEAVKPFDWFKAIWKEQGWDLFHLRALEDRQRKVFLETVLRVFLERMEATEPALNRLTALFGLYTFYNTQPTGEGISLYRQTHILIQNDTYKNLLTLPAELPPIFDHYATHILQKLVSASSFCFLPSSHTFAQNPRTLPHTFVRAISYNAPTATPLWPSAKVANKNPNDRAPLVPAPAPAPAPQKNKVGRPTSSEVSKRASRALAALDKWATATQDSARSTDLPVLVNPVNREQIAYAQAKSRLLEVFEGGNGDGVGVSGGGVDGDGDVEMAMGYGAAGPSSSSSAANNALKRAEEITIRNMVDVERYARERGLSFGREGIERVEKASKEPGGLLGLVRPPPSGTSAPTK